MVRKLGKLNVPCSKNAEGEHGGPTQTGSVASTSGCSKGEDMSRGSGKVIAASGSRTTVRRALRSCPAQHSSLQLRPVGLKPLSLTSSMAYVSRTGARGAPRERFPKEVLLDETLG